MTYKNSALGLIIATITTCNLAAMNNATPQTAQTPVAPILHHPTDALSVLNQAWATTWYPAFAAKYPDIAERKKAIQERINKGLATIQKAKKSHETKTARQHPYASRTQKSAYAQTTTTKWAQRVTAGSRREKSPSNVQQ